MPVLKSGDTHARKSTFAAPDTCLPPRDPTCSRAKTTIQHTASRSAARPRYGRDRGSCEKIGIKRYSPPCITARRGGRAIHKISRSIRLSRGRGGFPMNPKGKPPRLRLLWWLRHIFFDDAATPPCGGARRGITPYHN